VSKLPFELPKLLCDPDLCCLGEGMMEVVDCSELLGSGWAKESVSAGISFAG
jgi:hypothetical protein